MSGHRPWSEVKGRQRDELDGLLDGDDSPEFEAAYRAEKARLDRLVTKPCRYGFCLDLVDPDTGARESFVGPVGCPCVDDIEVTQEQAALMIREVQGLAPEVSYNLDLDPAKSRLSQ